MSPKKTGDQSRSGLVIITSNEEDFVLSIFTILGSAWCEVLVPNGGELLSGHIFFILFFFFKTTVFNYNWHTRNFTVRVYNLINFDISMQA